MPQLKVDNELIRSLAKLLEETGLTELELGSGDQRIRVARKAEISSQILSPQITPTIETEDTSFKQFSNINDKNSGHPGSINSPMVGTVYLSPEPGADPFVRQGEAVTEGQTLLIVEAMKTMNPIRAPRSGKIISVLVENGAPIEFGEALLIIE